MSVTAGPSVATSQKGFRVSSRSALAVVPYLALAGVFAILLVLIVFPVVILIIGSFLGEPPRALHFDWSSATLHNYTELMLDPGFLGLVGTTIGSALMGTAGAVVIGAGLAWFAIRTDIPARKLVELVAIVPMFVSPLVGAFAWDILASPNSGILNIVARSVGFPFTLNIYTVAGIGFVFSIYYAPYVFLLVAAALRNMDATLEEASTMCGAGRFQTIRKVTLPLVMPALLSGALLVFVMLISLFAIPAVLGSAGDIKFVSVHIWNLIGFAPPKVNEASALGVLMLVATIFLVWLQQRVLRRRSFVTVSGKGLRPRPMKLGPARWPLGLLIMLFLLVVAVLPYFALLLVALRKNLFYSSVTTLFDPAQFSTLQIGATLSNPVIQNSLKNSIMVGVGTVLIGSVLYFAVAYMVTRTKLRGRHALDAIAMMPIAIPGLIIGLGYLWSWITLPIGLYGSIWIIVLAYVSQFAPQGVRSISGSLVQIHPELEESSRLAGAGFLYTLRRVVLPLSWPGVTAAMTFLMALSFREISTALFLYTSDTQVFSVTMFDLWLRGSTAPVAVMALLQTAILLLLVVVGQRFGGGRGDAIEAAK